MDNNNYKSFDDFMLTTKKDIYKNLMEAMESSGTTDGEKVRVGAVLEMTKFDCDFELEDNSPKNIINIKDNIIKCRYLNESHLSINDDKKYDGVLIEAADSIVVESILNAKLMYLKKYEEKPLYGRVTFKTEQNIDALFIRNVGVKGTFISPIVYINGFAILDINLDVKDDFISPVIIIDTDSKNIRGNINITENYYNKLSDKNKNFLEWICSHGPLHLFVDGKTKYNYDILNHNYKKKNKNDTDAIYKELIDICDKYYEPIGGKRWR